MLKSQGHCPQATKPRAAEDILSTGFKATLHSVENATLVALSRQPRTAQDGLPDGVILAPMGGLTIYYHVPSILNDPALSGPDRRAKFFKTFAFLGEFLRDPSVIKIGSDIHADTAKLADLLDLPI